MKAYELYISERLGQSLLELPCGFVAYKCTTPECFINEFFILPEFRNSHHAGDLLSELEKIAIDNSCAFISAVVYVEDPGSHRTLKAAFKRGFKIKSAQNNSLVIVKKLEGV